MKQGLSIIGMCSNLGQKKVGVEKTIHKMLELNLVKNLESLNNNIHDITIYPNNQLEIENIFDNFEKIGYLNGLLSDKVYQSAVKNFNTLVVGGDHSIASGSLHGRLLNNPDLKVVWVDAHGDINTPSASPTANYHGMPVAHLLGLFKDNEVKGFNWLTSRLNPKNIIYIGLRDLDNFEKDILRKLNIKAYSPYNVDEMGIKNVMDETLKYFGEGEIACSFDIDGIDKPSVKGTGTPVLFGLTPREGKYILQRLKQTNKLTHLDMVEVNDYINDSKGESLEVAMELIYYAFGKNEFS